MNVLRGENWYFCESTGEKGRWVPAQEIENVNAKNTHKIDSYKRCAKEQCKRRILN
jgi:hypothetical protein